jgi:hypothetical protein
MEPTFDNLQELTVRIYVYVEFLDNHRLSKGLNRRCAENYERKFYSPMTYCHQLSSVTYQFKQAYGDN